MAVIYQNNQATLAPTNLLVEDSITSTFAAMHTVFDTQMVGGQPTKYQLPDSAPRKTSRFVPKSQIFTCSEITNSPARGSVHMKAVQSPIATIIWA
jgi:hypothetical protein